MGYWESKDGWYKNKQNPYLKRVYNFQENLNFPKRGSAESEIKTFRDAETQESQIFQKAMWKAFNNWNDCFKESRPSVWSL